ncbi:MAG: hypothetical protein HY823_14980 [Acidobacteria bacterium]|nr:hypothetical protein [Acidobacteriota bacterium]
MASAPATDDLKKMVCIVLDATPGGSRPEAPNGAQLTLAGIERAILAACGAFKIESAAWSKSRNRETVTTAVKRELKSAARTAGNLAEQLRNLTPEARWRIGALASDWAWQKPFEGSRTEYMFPKSLMELGLEKAQKRAQEHNKGLEKSDWDGVPQQDVEFLKFHAEGLADPRLEPWWPSQLQGLETLLELASQPFFNPETGVDEPTPDAEATRTPEPISTAGPREFIGVRKKESAKGLLGGYPVLLLIRECEAILQAAAPKPNLLESLNTPLGVPKYGDLYCASHPPTKGIHPTRYLKKLVWTVLTSLTGKEPGLDLMRDPMEKHKTGWAPPHSPDPFLWLSYRTAVLLMQDLRTRTDLDTISRGPAQSRLQMMISGLEDLVSRAPAQGSEFRMPGSRPLPPGRTFLSGVVR